MLKWAIEHAESDLGIIPEKIGIFGDEAGGYITAGLSALLGLKNEGHLVKFQAQFNAPTSHSLFTEADEYWTDAELGAKPV